MSTVQPLVVVDAVGLSGRWLGDNTPSLNALARRGFQAQLETVLPAVTCSVQSTLLTGTPPAVHGIVGNGWYFRDLSQVWLWRQSSRLVAGSKVWHQARERDPSFTCAQLFWWYNMYAEVDWAVTPRPAYFADGRKAGDVYCQPPELRDELYRDLGPFPFFQFWGPGSGLPASEWIVESARWVLRAHRPSLTLVYLPHLDYDLQRFGPNGPGIAREVRAVDRLIGALADDAAALGAETLVVSEYGIAAVSGSVSLNRRLREAGFLRVHSALNGELLDPGASRAFAVCDHQVAHVYVRDAPDIEPVRKLLESVEGVDLVLDREAQEAYGLDHPRSGELVAVSEEDRWFDYYYWLDEACAPDFARTVDIHQKPGYDPVELFLDPDRPFMKARVFTKLLARKLGFRSLLDVVPLKPELVRGSHGRLPSNAGDAPVLVSSSPIGERASFAMTDVADLILANLFRA